MEFFLDNETTRIGEMTSRTMNNESDTEEYWVTIDPATLTPGLHTIRAVAYPTRGLPRHLDGDNIQTSLHGQYKLPFIADPLNTFPHIERFVSSTIGSDTTGNGTTGAPFASIMKAANSIALVSGLCADGGIINLMAGGHTYGKHNSSDAILTTVTNKTWLTIRPAPGVSSEDCPIVTTSGQGGLRTKLVKLDNITVKPNSTVAPVLGNYSSSVHCEWWADNCNFVGQGITVNGQFSALWTRTYFTNCIAGNCRDALKGGMLVRNCHVGEISSDAFTGSTCVVNSSLLVTTDLDESEFHPDFFQFYSQGELFENTILYGLHLLLLSGTQGFFAGDIGHPGVKDFAMVNVSGSVYSPWRVFQYHCPVNHMLIQNAILNGAAQFRYDTNFLAKDIVFRNAIFDGVLQDPVFPEIDTIGNVLYLDGTV